MVKKKVIKATAIILMVMVALTAGQLANDIDKASAATTKPAQVKQLKVTNKTTSSITLKWGKTARAKGYAVYKKAAGAKKWSKVVTTKNRKATVKKLKSGKKYSFKVRAYAKKNGKKIWGKYSAIKTTKTKTEIKGGIAINEKNFPDSVFRKELKKVDYDKNQDGIFSPSEIAGIKRLFLDNKGIESLKGIEYLTSLESLSCGQNKLTSLDVSKNTALRELSCYKNQLTGLEVSNCKVLEYLECAGNQISSLNLRGRTALGYVDCSDNNLKTLDVSGCTALWTLACNNDNLTALNISECTALKNLHCTQNNLTALDVSGHTTLKTLYCEQNNLTTLDVSGCTALERLDCQQNNLTTLNVDGCTALVHLDCQQNNLTTLDVTTCTALKFLYCHDIVEVIWPR